MGRSYPEGLGVSRSCLRKACDGSCIPTGSPSVHAMTSPKRQRGAKWWHVLALVGTCCTSLHLVAKGVGEKCNESCQTGQLSPVNTLYHRSSPLPVHLFRTCSHPLYCPERPDHHR